MPPPATVENYVELIGKTGLVSDERLQESLAKIRSLANPPQSVESFAQACVSEGLLTKFQSRQIRLGRYKKFILNEKYRILELIGSGGMGAVYLCEHKFMRRLVAVKILPADKYDDPSNLERFIREARAVAALNHPNIVRAYDIDRADGIHFLVMEYVDGASLQEIVARYGTFDPLRAANCIAQAAVGLQHAMEKGLIHRDVKPGNVLLDRTGVVKLLDLGLARFFEPENDDKLTERFDEKCVLGTADYLAPEQALSNFVDIRADIYGLGGTFYYLLTGRSPVPEGNVTEKLLFHQQHEPVPVTDFRTDVPPAMLDVLRKMQKKDPNERFQTPFEVANALAEWAEHYDKVPADYEMPELCPAVVSLVGHSLERPRPSGVISGSNVMRFSMNRTLPPSPAKSSSQVLHGSDTGSSIVDIRPDPSSPGSLSPQLNSHSSTSPLPRAGNGGGGVRSSDHLTPQRKNQTGSQRALGRSDSSLIHENRSKPQRKLFIMLAFMLFVLVALGIVLLANSKFR